MTAATHPPDTTGAPPLDQAKEALAQDKPVEAWHAFQRALLATPDSVPALLGLAQIEISADRLAPAAARLARARELAPGNDAAWQHTAVLHLRAGDAAAAEKAAHEAIRLADPPRSELWGLLGEALRAQHQLRAAIDALERQLALDPANQPLDSGLLFQRNYFDWPDIRAEFQRCRQWDEHHARALRPEQPAFANDRDPDRRLRIGYISPDFRWHAVAHFARPVLAAHDHAALELFCYAAHWRGDLNSHRFAAAADHWVPVQELTDEALAQRILTDRIDVLVDLAGHSGGHRLLAFARQPAPVQVSWLGYCNTTGLGTISHRIVDAITDPPGPADGLGTEKIVRLPHGFHCYGPPEENPAVRPAPAPANGFVTFGSFNNAAKHTPEVVALWARVLHAVPGSRLLLKSGQYAHAPVRLWFLRQFAAHGIEAGRLRLVPSTPSAAEHFASFGLVDVALDPFPYNGTTTTCDALWMGVPVVALEGGVHRARVGCSLLHRVGHPEWAAATPEAYVATAARLAAEAAAGRSDRAALREAMRRSPLCDARGLARELELAYRQAWRDWLSGPRGGLAN